MPDAVVVTSLSQIEAGFASSMASQKESERYLALGGALQDIFLKHETKRRESGVEDALIANLYSYSGVYESQKLSDLEKSGMSTVNYNLVGEKCTDALSWLLDVFLGETDKPWRLKPTPVPTVPGELADLANAAGNKAVQDFLQGLGREPAQEDSARAASLARQAIQDAILIETARRAKAMERDMQDQLVEGGYNAAMADFLFDVVVEKAGILKGPIVRERQKKQWDRGASRPKLSYVWKPTLTVSRVSPFDAYPSAASVEFEGDFVERTRYTLTDLFWMLKQKHFIKPQVQMVIDAFSSTSGVDIRVVDSTLAPILRGQTGMSKVEGTIEGLDYWLTVTGAWLISAGWDALPFGGKIDAGKLYHIEAITAAGKVVFIGENEDPTGAKPYFKTGWNTIPGSFWYKGMPEILKDIGDVANASTRSLVNNLALSSGFQVIVPDVQRLMAGSITSIFPHKVWQFKNPSNSSAPPIQFNQPDCNVAALMGVIEACQKWADARSGVPKYLLGGSPPPGVGRTASGISMLLNSAAKGVRRVVIAIDHDVVCPLLSRIYEKNLEDSPDIAVLGDLEVAPAGAVETLIKSELSDRRLSLLDTISKSPDAPLISVRGRSELWREAFRAAELDGSSILVPVEKVEEDADRAAKAEQSKAEAESQAAQSEAQARQLEVQIAQKKLDVETQRFTMETKILELKLQAQIAENQQRTAITQRMASNVDYKTAQEIGVENVPSINKKKEPKDDFPIDEGPVETNPIPEVPIGIPESGGELGGVPEGTELPMGLPGGELPLEGAGAEPVDESVAGLPQG